LLACKWAWWELSRLENTISIGRHIYVFIRLSRQRAQVRSVAIKNISNGIKNSLHNGIKTHPWNCTYSVSWALHCCILYLIVCTWRCSGSVHRWKSSGSFSPSKPEILHKTVQCRGF
jgi:hypothetical protein